MFFNSGSHLILSKCFQLARHPLIAIKYNEVIYDLTVFIGVSPKK